MDSRKLPYITICKHSSQCHPETQVKALLRIEDTCEHHLETMSSSLDQSLNLLKKFWETANVESYMKKDRDHPACCLHTVQKRH